LNGKGSLNVAIPGQLTIGNNFSSFDYTQPATTTGWLKPSGMGVGLDLGVTFKPITNLTLSAAVTDFG
jgi:hypothetical protein